MRLSSRRADDADVIRARLRMLLDEGHRRGGWLPDDRSDVDPSEHDLGTGRPDGFVLPVAAGQVRPEGDDGLPAGMGRHRAPGPAVRVAPGRSGGRALAVAGLLGALLLVGWTWMDRPRAEPVGDVAAGASTPAPEPGAPSGETTVDTAATVTVSVVGRVARPGLVVLPRGARVAEAVAAAGGLLPDADPAAVNLAAVLTDGQQIAVGVPAPGPGAGTAPPSAGGRVSLNGATAAELDALPGIGPVLAQRIVEYRTENGPFTAVEQLEDVPGIGPAIFDELVDLVAV